MEPHNTTTDIYFAAALLCEGECVKNVYRVGKRVHFEFDVDISQRLIKFMNNTLHVPARYFGVNMKHLKAIIQELY